MNEEKISNEEKVLNEELINPHTDVLQNDNSKTKLDTSQEQVKTNAMTQDQEKVLNEELISPETTALQPETTDLQKDNSDSKPDIAQESEKDDIVMHEQTLEKKDESTGEEHSLEEVKEEVIKILKTCYDPEIPVDIWELGLIYDIVVATNRDVLIVMTLTSPSCPVAGTLPTEVEQRVKEHPMVNDCKVQLTFDPPWSQKMMSEVAKLELGFL